MRGGVDEYGTFLEAKLHESSDAGFDPIWMPDFLFPFQRTLIEWGLRKGKAALFADCGLGKSPMELVWAENVVRHTNRPVLIATPLAVSYQVLREAEKFGIDCRRVTDGTIPPGARVLVTNYERLAHFSPRDVAGFVGDESSILKNFDGVRKATITEFVRPLPYRLLGTATAAPNDYIELGTTSEALGELGYTDMLLRFFKNDTGTCSSRSASRVRGDITNKWRFKHHAEQPFWRWVCSWARAVRRPSDLGFDDGAFVLPPLTETEHVVTGYAARDGMLFNLPSAGLHEEREERRRSIQARCERVAELVTHDQQALVWCHLNPEADLLERLIPGAKQVAGSDSDDEKEETLKAFADGDLRVLVTKPKIGAWGLNLQRCAHVTFFPSHSYEQYYQGVRRCWRFGQQQPVHVDIVATEGERQVLANLRRKATAADRMFSALVEHMHAGERVEMARDYPAPVEVPAWL